VSRHGGCTLGNLARYFVRLGTVGFGGPIALVGYMQRDLVDDRRWLTAEEYRDGLALAQLAPGPLAAQLAIYIGWLRHGAVGATAIAVAFVAPSFLMVLALSALYVRFGGLAWMRGAFYGIGAAVIAIIARSAYKLTRMTLGRDRALWGVFALNAAVVARLESEVVWVFLASGAAVWLLRETGGPARRRGAARTLALFPAWLVTGLHGPAEPGVLGQLGWFFAKAGALVFGSGLAIVPFLYGGAVERYGWLTERQFLDAVAVSMITPGPVVITVAFVGYLAAGPLGAGSAALGVFLPVYLAVLLLAPAFRRVNAHAGVRAFVAGVTAAATGAIAGAAVVLARRAIVDVPTLLLALATLGVLLGPRKVPEPALILAAGMVGVLVAPG
jgi:chromate transporter